MIPKIGATHHHYHLRFISSTTHLVRLLNRVTKSVYYESLMWAGPNILQEMLHGLSWLANSFLQYVGKRGPTDSYQYIKRYELLQLFTPFSSRDRFASVHLRTFKQSPWLG